jgi:DNA-binding transcriptional LysR family regulator
MAAWRAGTPDPIRWIVRSQHGVQDWAREGEVPAAQVPFRTTDGGAQIVAVRQGLGVATLDCVVGDSDPLLARTLGAPCTCTARSGSLTHGETRKTKRVRLFTEFVSRRLASHLSRPRRLADYTADGTLVTEEAPRQSAA